MTTAGWIFFAACWVSIALNAVLVFANTKLAASLKQARALLLTAAENQAEEIRVIIYDYLEATRR